MGKYLILTALFFISLGTYAQGNENIENRKGKLFFKTGSDFRITPIYSINLLKENTLRTSIDRQSSGAAFLYAFEFFTGKNFSLNFSQSFHYTLFSYENFDDIPGENGFARSTNALFIDFHFYINYYIKLFKKSEIFLRVGKSMLNRNSNYSEKTSFYDGDEYIGGSLGEGSFNFSPYNFGLGYKKNKVEILLGIYSTSNTPYFAKNPDFIIPYFNLAYTIGKM
jgi:hypothetical protein